MAALKVLHIAPGLFGEGGVYGGGERYAWELSRAMAKRATVRLVAFAGQPPAQTPTGVAVYPLRNWMPGGRFAGSPLSPALLPHLRWADVIHCHQVHNLAADCATLYAGWARKPVFGTDHGGGGYSVRRGRGFSGRLFVSRFSQRMAGAPQPRDAVIWGGVDTQRFQPAPGIERDVPVLFVGRLLPHKGIDVLIRAAAQARLPLTVAGRPDPGEAYLDHLRRQAAASPLPVTFVTDCDDATLVRYYQRAGCVVLPSVPQSDRGAHPVAELLGQTLLEAMACGAPVIASRFGGMLEVVDEGRTGALVAPGDAAALAQVLSEWSAEPAAARALGEAARDHVLRHFTWDAVVERCLAAYAASGAAR